MNNEEYKPLNMFPTPWRLATDAPGWLTHMVVFAANDEVIHHQHNMPEIVELWQGIVDQVNNAPDTLVQLDEALGLSIKAIAERAQMFDILAAMVDAFPTGSTTEQVEAINDAREFMTAAALKGVTGISTFLDRLSDAVDHLDEHEQGAFNPS